MNRHSLRSVIVVDDESSSRTTLCSCFPWENYGFFVAGEFDNGKVALDYLENNSVDVVLCDIKMPVLDGLQFAQAVDEGNIDTKIVFLSAYGEFEYAKAAIRFGVRDYILKPAKFDELEALFTRLQREIARIDPEEQGAPAKDHAEMPAAPLQLIAQIEEFVKQNCRDITLDLVADHVRLNPNYLSQFYKRYKGDTFSSFVLKTKMEQACTYLSNLSYKIYEVGYMVGYSSSNNFSRCFRKYFGFTPREYRDKVTCRIEAK